MEEEHRLPFATLVKLREDLAELIVDDAVELDLPMVDRVHNFLEAHLTAPFSVLVNMVNSYSFSPEAQLILFLPEGLHSIGVAAYSRQKVQIVEMLADFPRAKAWNMEVFPTRRAAIEWLTQQQDALLVTASSSHRAEAEVI